MEFKKAFDTLEWSFIQKTLMHFNFNSLLNWVNLFYTDIESRILNNSWPSDLFQLNPIPPDLLFRL